MLCLSAIFNARGNEMIRWLKVTVLKFRAGWLEAQIDHGEALLLSHRVRLQRCYAELRRVRQAEAMITPAATLLEQALRRKHG